MQGRALRTAKRTTCVQLGASNVGCIICALDVVCMQLLACGGIQPASARAPESAREAWAQDAMNHLEAKRWEDDETKRAKPKRTRAVQRVAGQRWLVGLDNVLKAYTRAGLTHYFLDDGHPSWTMKPKPFFSLKALIFARTTLEPRGA